MPAVSNPSKIIEAAGDCISFLPDEILLLILSHIPTKFAIRTSVLSKRWKHVWLETPSISIDSCGVDPSLINKTLSTFLAPKITSFSLSVNYGIKAPQVDSWIQLAMSLNAESLSLTFISRFQDPGYRFPPCFFVKFGHLRVHYDQISDVFPKCTVAWTSLRRLSLNRWNLSRESIAKILSGLLMLESLTLGCCTGLYHLDLRKSVNLRRLEIKGSLFSPGPGEIVAPHIHFLRLANSPQRCTLGNVSSLTEANLNIDTFSWPSGDNRDDFLQDTVVKMLAKLQNIEKLTVGAMFLKILSVAELRGVPFPLLKMKALVIETIIVRSVIPGIVRLLRNAPELKEIKVHTTECETRQEEVRLETYLTTQGLIPDPSWNELFPTVVQTSSIHDGSAKAAKSKHVASFIELVLQKAMALETMVIRLEGYLSATEYQKLLQMVPTLSSRKRNVRKHSRDKAVLISFKITP